MAITADLHREPARATRRSAARRKLLLDLEGHTASGDAASVTVLNLSTTGVLLRTREPIRVGERLRLVFPGDEVAGAKVVWAGEGLFGCRFDKPVGQATVSAARLKSEIDVADDAVPDIALPEAREETFGTRVKQLRKARGISLIGLARILGVSKPAVWKWERDEVRPRPETLTALAAALQVSPSELVFGAEGSHASVGRPKELGTIIAGAKAEIARLLGIRPDSVTVTVAIRD